MSGAKVSIYSLSKELRENCLAQLACIRACGAMRQELEEAMAQLDEMVHLCERELAVQEKLDPGSEAAAQLRALADKSRGARNRAWDSQRTIKAVPTKAVVPRSVQDTEALDALRETQRALTAAVTVVREAMEAADERREGLDALRSELAARRQARSSEIRDAMALDVSFDLEEVCAPCERPDTAQTEERLSQLAREKDLPEALRDEAARAAERLHRMNDPEQIANYLTVTVRPMEKRLRGELRAARAAQTARRAQWRHYASLCETLGETPVLPENGAEARVEQAIAEMEERAAEQAGRDYIGEAVRQVMREMGYDMLGERDVTKRSGRSFHSELYQYGEGKAIAVTRSEGGQIAMELGGLVHGDAAPDEMEADRLTESMGVFCQDFTELEKRLSRHGVQVSRRLRHLPADPRYAVMINMDDYGLTDGRVSTLAEAEEHRSGTRAQASEVDEG